MTAWLRVEQQARGAVGDGVTPALSFRVLRGVTVEYALDCGRLGIEADAPPTRQDTVFDLASLTKPLTTWLWALRALERGLWDLESRIGDLVTVADPALARCDVTRLLTHTTGLPAHRAYFHGLLPWVRATRDFSGVAETIRRMVRRTPLEQAPGEQETYSDVGFLLLENVLETVDQPLSRVWPTLPLHGPSALHFRPLVAPMGEARPALARVAVTERSELRGGFMHGEVHDENAWTLGGVAGHAGLFGTADDVAAFGRAVLDTWHGRGEPLGISTALLRESFSPRWLHPRGTRVLGWDTPSPGASSAGHRFGKRTVGHLGFTGTSIWIDLDAEVLMVLLTNRVCPSRDDIRIRKLRPILHDAAWEALGARGGGR
ncbi:MAG: serine hydrolase domain-containing protein [Bradymonadia bacterium]|jgi:CubicO group peptidase (beta-lactamase class C family)